MKSVIVYDSWYENTHKIAEAIADGLNSNVQIVKVDEVPSSFLEDCELLIVGSPTHGGVATPAMQEFLSNINADDLEGIAVAAFDTRIRLKFARVIGFAAKRIARRLLQTGGTLIVPAKGFYVHGKEGPLVDGELDRAREWGALLAEKANTAAMV